MPGHLAAIQIYSHDQDHPAQWRWDNFQKTLSAKRKVPPRNPIHCHCACLSLITLSLCEDTSISSFAFDATKSKIFCYQKSCAVGDKYF